MDRIDLKRDLKQLYRPSATAIAQVDVPAFAFLMIDGEGDPNTSDAYAEAVEALFSVSYTAKFMVKKGPQRLDYAVMPLEGLWWADDLSAFTAGDKAGWKWTMMIMQPSFVAREIVAAAIADVAAKKRLAAIARLHAFVHARTGLAGKHHEIYLSDIRRADPKRWKTILRQPMRDG